MGFSAAGWLGEEVGGLRLPTLVQKTLEAGYTAGIWEEDDVPSLDEDEDKIKRAKEYWATALSDSAAVVRKACSRAERLTAA